MYPRRNHTLVIITLLLALVVAGCRKDPQAQKAEFTASGDKLMASQKYSDAIIQYRNALKIDPYSSVLFFKLGEAYFRNAQLREAFGKNGVPAMISPLKVSVPELETLHAVPVMVIVPPEGDRLPLAPTVRAEATLKLLEVETVADAAMVSP